MKKIEKMIYQDSWINAFVDETGNTDIETSKEGATNYFICVAVIIEDKKTEEARAKIDKVRKKHFKKSEIKSSKISSNHKRRLKILRDLENIDFSFFTFVVNKTQIKSDSGLQHKSSFYKFFNRMLYDHLLLSGDNLNIIADNIGGKSFMIGFGSYLKSKGKPNLFSKWTHSFADSKNEPLIQLADLIAGSLTYVYDPEKKCKYSEKIFESLKAKQIDITGWPLLPDDKILKNNSNDNKFSNQMFVSNIQRALTFISENEKSEDENKKMQVIILSKLLFLRIYAQNTKNQSLLVDDLINHLEFRNFPKLKKQIFHSKIIGPIRDEGIIISGTNRGMKLASTTEDINEYIAHDKSIIEPMLERLCKARQVIKVSTMGKVDILESGDFTILQKISDTFSDIKTEELFQVKEAL